MTITTDAVLGMSHDIFATLGLRVRGTPLDVAPPPPTAREMTAFVLISGDWKGAVSVQCSDSSARRVAASMFGCAEAEVDADQLVDALGELANMMGGNLKSVLGVSCALSLPAVVAGDAMRVSLPHGQQVLALRFGVGADDAFVLRVIKAEEVRS